MQTAQGFTLSLYLIRKVSLSITTPDALTAFPPQLVGSEFSFSPSLSKYHPYVLIIKEMKRLFSFPNTRHGHKLRAD